MRCELIQVTFLAYLTSWASMGEVKKYVQNVGRKTKPLGRSRPRWRNGVRRYLL